MNKNKREQISKTIARRILEELSACGCFDGFITRFYTKAKCINSLQKSINEYFYKGNKQLGSWNKNTWLDIFDDSNLVDTIVFYMQDFNLAKEIEETLESNLKNKK